MRHNQFPEPVLQIQRCPYIQPVRRRNQKSHCIHQTLQLADNLRLHLHLQADHRKDQHLRQK